MKTSLKRILTALLVVVMLFTTVATTVLAATDATSSESATGSEAGAGSNSEATVGGTLDTGWCEITYTDKELIVTLRPDVKSLLAINEAEIRAIFDILVDAVKSLVVDDIKAQILGGTKPASFAVAADDSTESEIGGINKDNIWESALGIFIRNEYDIEELTPDLYLAFFQDLIDEEGGEALLNRFVDYTCKVLKDSVALGFIKIDDLPKPEDVENLIADLLEDILQTQINGKVTEYVDAYLAYLIDGTPHNLDSTIYDAISKEVVAYIKGVVNSYLDDSLGEYGDLGDAVGSFINAEIKSYVDTALKNYFKGVPNDEEIDKIIDAEFKAHLEENLDKYLDEYADTYIEDYVDSYFEGLDKGTADPEITAKIKDQLKVWIGEVVTSWPDKPVDNPIYDYVKDTLNEKIEEKTDELIDDYINDYVNGTIADEDIKAAIDDAIASIFDSYVENRFDGDDTNNDAEYQAIHDIIDPIILKAIRDKAEAEAPELLREEIIEAAKEELYNKILEEAPENLREEIIEEVKSELYTEIYNEVFDEMSAIPGITEDDILAEIDTKYNEALVSEEFLQEVENAYNEALLSDEYKQAIEDAYNEALVSKEFSEEIEKTYNEKLGGDEYLAAIEEAIEEAYASLTKDQVEDEIANIDIADYITADAWDSLSEEQKASVIENVRNALPNKEKEFINDYWAANADSLVDTAFNKITDKENREAFKEQILSVVEDNLTITADDIIKFLNDNPDVKASIVENANYATILELAFDKILEKKNDPTIKGVIEDKIAELTGDAEELIKTIREILSEIHESDEEKYESIVEGLYDTVHNKLQNEEFINEAFLHVVGLTKGQYDAKIEHFTEVFIEKYAKTLEELTAETPEISLEQLIGYIKEFRIGEHVIYTTTPYGGEISTDAIKALIKSLPLPAEIANMKDEDMRLSYDLTVVTDFGTCEFTLTGVVGGGYDKVRRFAKILSDNLDIFNDTDGTLNVKVNVPARFAKLLLKACNTTRLSDSLKQKVFIALNKTPDDLVAYINGFTFEELIELLDNVYLDKILDSEFISKFEKLDGLTKEEIFDKIKEYEYYFNKIISYMNKFYKERIPEKYKTMTIFDFYRGHGKFSVAGECNIDLEKLLTKISERYGSLITSFLQEYEIYFKFDFEVTFEKLNKIEYVIDGVTHRNGFLPAGADIEFFAGITSYNGSEIYGWVDSTGVMYTEMPDSDIVLYALIDTVDAFIGGTSDNDYNGEAHTLSAIVNYQGTNPVFTYEWYKDGVKLEGQTGATLDLVNVSDSGVYWCVITITDGAFYKVVTTPQMNVVINPLDFDVNDLTLDENWFDYTGEPHTVNVLGIPSDLEATITGAIETEPGEYTVSVVIGANENYNFVNGNAVELKWTIGKALFDASNIELDENKFIYNGNEISPEILGLGELVLGVDYTVSGDISAVEPGNYEIVISLDSTKFDFGDVTEIRLPWVIKAVRDLSAIRLASDSFTYIGAKIIPVVYGLDDYVLGVDYDFVSGRSGENAGDYEMVITFYENDVYGEQTISLLWTINKIKVNVSWNYIDAFKYDGKSHEVYLVYENGDKFEFATYVNDSEFTNVATDIGNYVARAVINPNYEVVGGVEDLSWVIARNIVYVSNIELDNSEFTYDGTVKAPVIIGLDDYIEGVHYVITGTTSATDAGNYQIVVKFLSTPELTYSPTEITLDWTVNKKAVAPSWNYNAPFTYDKTEHSVYLVDENGIAVDYVTYTGVYAATNAGTYKVVVTVNSNYYVASELLELEWVINKAVATLPEIKLESTEFAYNGEEITPVITGIDGIESSEYELHGDISATLPGNYTIVIHFSENGNYDFGTVEDIVLEWSIISTGEKLTWNYKTEYVYNGKELSVYLVDASGNKITDVTYVIGGAYTNVATNAGTYKAKVIYDPVKYSVDNDEIEWTINRANYDMSGISFNDASIVHDGKSHSIKIKGTLPEGVTVTYTDNDFIEVGTYTVTAIFTGDSKNYNPIDSMTATLTITVNPYDIVENNFTLYDASGKPVITITAENGIPTIFTLSGNDVTPMYISSLVSNDVFGSGKVGKVLSAYDVSFVLHGMKQPVNDNFTVEYLIPSVYANGTRDLKVVYIAENGDIVDMNAAVVDGKMVFETTHFSVYAIVEVVDANAGSSSASLWWLWLIIILVAIVLVLLLIIFIIKKNKGNDENPEEPVTEETTDEPTEPEDNGTDEALPPTEEEPAPAEEKVEESVASKEEENTEAPAPVVIPASDDEDENVGIRIIDGKEVPVRYRSSYMSRLIQSDSTIQDYYTVIKNALLSYDGVKARLSWNYESFNKGRIQCAKLNVKGKNFLVYLALDPKEYNASKYHFSDVSDKPKLDKVPMMLKVKSERGLKYATELIEEMMAKLGIERVETAEVDYHMPYESTEALVDRDLVKVILPTGVSIDDVTSMVKVDVGEHIDSAKQRDDGDEPEITIVIEESSEESEN